MIAVVIVVKIVMPLLVFVEYYLLQWTTEYCFIVLGVLKIFVKHLNCNHFTVVFCWINACSCIFDYLLWIDVCLQIKKGCNLKCVQLYVDVLARGCWDPQQNIDKYCSNPLFSWQFLDKYRRGRRGSSEVQKFHGMPDLHIRSISWCCLYHC